MPVDDAEVLEEYPGLACGLRYLPWNLPAATVRGIARSKEDQMVEVHRERVQRFVAPKSSERKEDNMGKMTRKRIND